MSCFALVVRTAGIAGCLLQLALSAACVLAAEPAKLTVAAAEPPKEIAEPIRAVLDQKSIRLATGNSPFYEFWFRKDLPLAEKPQSGALDVATVKEGTLLGAVQVSAERSDFRNEEVPPGVYTLRLGLQPEDGNHQGTSPTRTFALLSAAKLDTKLDPLARDELLKRAASINAAKHPSIFNLQQVEKVEGEFPRLEERDDGELKVVLVKIPGRVAAAGEPAEVAFALVYEGHGHL